MSYTRTLEDLLPLGMHVNVSNFNYLPLLCFGSINPHQRFSVILPHLMWLSLKLFVRKPI